MPMTSSVPYLLRAINEWIVNNGCTPYLIVDAAVNDTCVPVEYVKDGQIVLNIAASAIRDLVIGDEHITFSGRFGGVPHEIYAPMAAVMGIVAKENGEGMWFPRAEPPPKPERKQGQPRLKVVK